MSTFWHTRKRIVALSMAAALSASMVWGVAVFAPSRALGADPVIPVTDPATYGTFSQFEIQSGTSASGSVWTDKTVFGQDVTDQSILRGAGSLPLAQNEMGVALGALSSAQRVDTQEKVPVDLVMILDNSYSMTQCVDSTQYCTNAAATGALSYTGTRAYAMVQAVESAIETFADANPDNRIAIAQFGSGASIIQPLGKPQKIAGTNVYVAFTPPTSDGGAMYLRTASNASPGLQIGKSGSTVQSTNMQLGLYVGMNILASQPRASVTGAFQRTPNVLMFTDGEPTYSDTANTWWAPTGAGTQGPGSPTAIQYFGNGFKAALTAAYLKNAINDVYNDPAFEAANGLPRVQPRVFTVGLGLPALQEQGKNLAYATLDPKTLLGGTANSMQTDFTNSWATYSGGASVSVSVNTSNASFTVTHPTGAAAVYDPTDLKYNDAFYQPNTLADLKIAFEEITQQIVSLAPVYPIQVEDGQDATTSGYVTFTDPLGPFMQVTDMSLLSFCSMLEGATACDAKWFGSPTATDLGGGLTRYTFSGTYSAVQHAGPQNVANIIVTVQRYAALSQGDVVTVKIPAALLPQVVTTVTLNADGNPVSMTTQASQPVYALYKVAPKAGVVDALSNPGTLTDQQDRDALAAYVEDHTVGKQVRFYSDDYAVAAGQAQALTTATWTPASDNTFYRFATDTALYADQALTSPAITQAQWDAMAPADVVWHGVTLYVFADSTETTVVKKTVAVPITKAQLLAAQDATHQIKAVGGAMTAPAGMEDMARAVAIDSVKCLASAWTNGQQSCPGAPAGDGNKTSTAPMDRLTSVSSDLVSTELGNNGYLAYDVPGSLAINLTVQSAAGLTPNPAVTFPFTVDLQQASTALTGTFAYEIFDTADLTTPIGPPGTIASGGQLSLKASQTVVIYGLPDGATYTVTQGTLPAGYSVVSPVTPATGVHDGSITSGETAQAPFVDKYAPAPAKVTPPTAVNTLENRAWQSGDDFEARLCPASGPQTGCQTDPFATNAGTTDPGTAGSDFTQLTFTAPGTYDYVIAQDGGDSLPGVSNSGAVYEWQVVVVDDGSGTLKATTSLKKLKDDQGDTISPTDVPDLIARFVNVYNPRQIEDPLTAVKVISDLSAPSEGDLADGMQSFSFKFRSLGPNPKDPLTPGAPAPVFTSVSPPDVEVTAGSSGSVVSSPVVEYDGRHAGSSFYFTASEIDGHVPGITVSTDVWFYRVDVTADPISGELSTKVTTCKSTAAAVAANPPFGTCDPDSATYTSAKPLFTNTYDPAPAVVSLQATDSIDGRDWVPSGSFADSFGFTLVGADPTTVAALAPGGGVTLGNSGSCTGITVTGGTATQTASTPSPASFCFGATFTKQGVYSFELTQESHDGVATGMTYDGHVAFFQVVVTDDLATAQLKAVVTVLGNPPGDPVAKFVNHYQSGVVFTGVDVVKQLTGRDFGPGEFSFKLTTADAESCAKALLPTPDCAMTVLSENGSTATGAARLPSEIDFTQDDLGTTLTYTITESVPTDKYGVTYDTTVYDVTIVPKYDEATGLMYTETTVSTIDAVEKFDSRVATVTPGAAFRNTYAAAPVEVTPAFTNALSGRDWIAADAFTYTIEPLTAGAPTPAVTSVTLTSGDDPDFSFGKITFTKPGVYQYAVAQPEPASPLGGLTYDLATSIVTVTVTDDGQGKLVAAIDYGGKQAFVNHYGVWASWDLFESVTLHGHSMAADQFDFLMVPDDAESAGVVGIPMTGYEWSNAVGRPDGMPETMVAPSPEVTLTQDDAGNEYCYTISEVVPTPKAPGITYDTTKYHVCVDVVDDHVGNLVVTTVATSSSGAITTQVHHSDDSFDVDPADAWLILPFVNLYRAPAAQQVAHTGGGVTPDAGPLALIALGLMATGAVALALGRRRGLRWELID